MALRVVQRDVVHRDIDAGGIGATHSHRRVAHTGTRVTGRDDARGHRQQERDVQAVVLGSQLLAGDISKCYRSAFTRTRTQYLHLAQGDSRHRVGCRRLCCRNKACHHRGSHQEGLLHCF